MDREIRFIQATNQNAALIRMQIIDRNREMIEAYIVDAEDKDTAFIIYELHDLDGIAEDVSQFIRKSHEDRMIPTQILQMSRWTAYRLLKNYQRQLHKDDRRNPKESPVVESLKHPAQSGWFHVVVIAKGGKQGVQLPIPAK